MYRFNPGDIVYDGCFPELKQKGVVLGYTRFRKYVDILIRREKCFSISTLPENDLIPTEEHVNISKLVEWFELVDEYHN